MQKLLFVTEVVMKTKLQSWGFTLGHLQLIGIAVVVFAILVATQTGFPAHLHAMFSKADDTKPMLTYDDVHAQVAAENNSNNNSADDTTDQQIALLNRTDDDGQVLGDAIGLGTIPTADQLFSREQLDAIPVKTVPTNKDSVAKYQTDLSIMENDFDTPTLIGNLNGNDPQVIKQTVQQIQSLIDKLQTLSVPDQIADYNRYKIMYYQTLINIGNAFVNNDQGSDFRNSSTALFSLVDMIGRMQNDILTKYGVQL